MLKSLTVLDLDGGHVASVSYDSTKPLEQLLAEVALSIPDENSLVGLLPQLKGARIAVEPPGGSSLGIRTCLNVLGVLANPAGVSRQLVGVWHRSLIEPVAKALSLLKAENAWVVHGSDGLDEVTLAGKTFVGAVKDGVVRPYTISPADFGLKNASIDGLRKKSAKESASVIREVLESNSRDEARSLIVLNAAAALVIGGVASDPMHAARLAERSIDSGQAQNKLERLIQVTNKK